MTQEQANQLQAIYNELCVIQQYGEIINPIVLGEKSYVMFDIKGYNNFHFDFKGHVYIDFVIYGYNDNTSGSGDKLFEIATNLNRPSTYTNQCVNITDYNTMKVSVDDVYSTEGHLATISNFYFD